MEVPEYVPPDDVPLDDQAAKEKAARYEQTKRLFNLGKGARNAVGKVERYTPPIHIKRRAVAMIEAGHTLEEVRQHVWDVTREKVYLLNQRQLNGWAKTVQKFLVCQQGPIGAEIGTLGPRGRLRVLIFD